MVQSLREIRDDMVAIGATPAQLARVDAAIAAAQASDQARARASSSAQAEFNKLLKDRSDAVGTFTSGYVAARKAEMDAEEEALNRATATANLYAQLTGERNADLDDQIRIQQASNLAMKEQGAAAGAAADKMGEFMKGVGLGKTFGDSFLGSMVLAGPEGFAALGAKMADLVSLQSLSASGLAKMQGATVAMFTEFDKAQASLSKTTASTGEYNDMLYDVQESNRSYNVSIDDAAAAIGDLHNEMTIFNKMSSEQQTMLVETTARMEALGVSTKAGAQQFDNMIMGMGMSANVANEATLELVNLGDEIGVAAEQLSGAFNSAASELAKYGPGAIDVFKGMAAAAKSTGIEMGALMGITEKFDTFEGAAQSAGKLNAILGGGVVNSMDLLNGTEEERVRLLIQSMSLSGKNFESLNRFEKQAIASAAGISDMTEANKLFSMSLSSYDEMQDKASGANAEAAKLQERAQAATTFTEKLTQIGQAFAVGFMPVLEFAHGFANIILEINDMTGGVFIPMMVGLVTVFALLSRVQQLNNMAMSAGTGLQAIRALQTGGLASAQAVLAGTTIAEGEAAALATVPTATLASSMTALLVPVLPLTPAISALGFGMLGLGLALAAPLIAIAAVVTAFTTLFTAMLEAPKAIAAAVAGLLGFAVAGAVAMVILAKGMAAAVMILIPFTFQMMMVAPALMYFSAAVAVAAVAFYLLALGLERMGEALQVWNDVEVKSLLMAAAAIGLFLGMLIPLAVPAMTVGALVGIPLILFGMGLQQFAKGIAEFNKVGIIDLAMAAASVAAFVGMLIAIATQTAVVNALVGIPLLIFGIGLQQFAKGLAEFNKVGGWDMIKAAVGLAGFTLLLIPIAFVLPWIVSAVAIPLLMLSLGLYAFAVALAKFNDVGLSAIPAAVFGLWFLVASLILLALPIMVIGDLVAIPLILMALGLFGFALALKQFNDVGSSAIPAAVAGLWFLVSSLALLAIPIMIVGNSVAIPLIMLSLGLIGFAIALKQFNDVGLSAIPAATAGLWYLVLSMTALAIPLFIIGNAVAIPLLMLAVGLFGFALALKQFNGVAGSAIPAMAASLFLLGAVLLAVGIPLALAAPFVSFALIALGAGLYFFAQGLAAFNGVGMGAVFVAVAALTMFGAVMAWFIITGILGAMVTGFMALALPLMAFGAGLMTMGMGLLLIAAGMPALMALGDVLSVIAEIGFFGAIVFDLLAYSILGIAAAMMLIPESKTIAFGFAMQGYSAAMAAVSALTPESVTAAEKVVESAAEYAEIQATMKMPDEDSFIQAMKNVFGIGEGKDKKQGQDIILQLNGRELGRAIDAAINRRHNLAID